MLSVPDTTYTEKKNNQKVFMVLWSVLFFYNMSQGLELFRDCLNRISPSYSNFLGNLKCSVLINQLNSTLNSVLFFPRSVLIDYSNKSWTRWRSNVAMSTEVVPGSGNLKTLR